MTTPSSALIKPRQLHGLTPARIGLARAGSSISTSEVLKFDRDHARARDAVHLAFDVDEVIRQLRIRELPFLQVHSAAADRSAYLQRPDLGRQLDAPSRDALVGCRASEGRKFDLGIVIADGLSTRAIHANAIAFLDRFLPRAVLRAWRCAPVIIASQARVALADEICELLEARLSIILIGERPGLSASDSMGIYVTYAPRRGRSDAERNCISNIRPQGLAYPEAARKLETLISAAFRSGLSGVLLKEQVRSRVPFSDAPAAVTPQSQKRSERKAP